MAGTRAAIRYAKAVLSLASDQNTAETVNADMKLISQAATESKAFTEMLKSSIIKAEQKKESLLKIFPELNSVTTGLFEVLITNKRMDILSQVAQKYNTLFDKLHGREVAIVTTAVPITEALEAKVLAKVKSLTGKEVEIKNQVDPNILGGFILRIGDLQYNASIANKLNRLKREFSLN